MSQSVRIQTHHYGTSAIGIPYYTHERCYLRIDRYTSPSGEVTPQRVFCLDRDDMSDQADLPYAQWPGNVKYHPQCASCWLGHAHTVASHNAQTDNEQKPWD
jgi:hypothetical protein